MIRRERKASLSGGRLRQSDDLGVETLITERFGQAGVPKEKISMVKDTYPFISPDKSPTQLIELL
jgi:hypothetical protein